MRAREVAAVWALLVADVALTFVTYTRLHEHLYHVSGSGAERGAARALVELNMPAAAMAAGVLAVVARRLPRGLLPLVAISVALCAVVAAPGVLELDDLDAKPINALPAVGVLLAFAVSLVARMPPSPKAGRGDAARAALAAVVVLIGLPWIAAALGFYLDGVPVLADVFQTGKRVSFHGNQPHAAVHHGVHHGLWGVLLVLSALLLSRRLADGTRIAPAVVALMLAYGLGNIANDAGLEQIAERGWTDRTFPDVVRPGATWGWLCVVLAAAAISLAWWPRDRDSAAIRLRSAA